MNNKEIIINKLLGLVENGIEFSAKAKLKNNITVKINGNKEEIIAQYIFHEILEDRDYVAIRREDNCDFVIDIINESIEFSLKPLHAPQGMYFINKEQELYNSLDEYMISKNKLLQEELSNEKSNKEISADIEYTIHKNNTITKKDIINLLSSAKVDSTHKFLLKNGVTCFMRKVSKK